MSISITRRQFVANSARLPSGAVLAAGLAENSKGYGTPVQHHLKLKVLNPDAPVIDAKLKTDPRFNCEFPVSVVTAGGRRHVFISSGGAQAYSVPPDLHILRQTAQIRRSEPVYAIGGFDFEIKRGLRNLLTSYDAQKVYWRKNYCGTFNVDVLPADETHPEWVFSINHCENKNERISRPYGTFYFNNSINRYDPAGPDTSSGSTPHGYRDYQPGYFGLVSMSYAPVVAETHWGVELRKHDMGPILWPRTGFLTPDGKRKNPGYKNPHPHPSSLIAEDPRDGKKYLYVFSLVSALRRDAFNMVSAARSPIKSRAIHETFVNFYKGEYTEPSLPANMSEDIAVLATRPGGKVDCIHPTAQGRMNRFFVARLIRSGLFLAVESRFVRGGNSAYIETALRLSEDLRTWTDRFVIQNSRVNARRKRTLLPPFGMYYPKFLSGDGSSHYEIDESEPFYIIATKPHALVYRELSIEIL